MQKESCYERLRPVRDKPCGVFQFCPRYCGQILQLVILIIIWNETGGSYGDTVLLSRVVTRLFSVIYSVGGTVMVTIRVFLILVPLFLVGSDHDSGFVVVNPSLLDTLVFSAPHMQQVPASDYLQSSPDQEKDPQVAFYATVVMQLADLRDEILKLKNDINDCTGSNTQKVKDQVQSLRDDVVNWQDNVANFVRRPVEVHNPLYRVNITCKNEEDMRMEGKVKARQNGADIFLSVSPVAKKQQHSSVFSFIWKYTLVSWVWHTWIGFWR